MTRSFFFFINKQFTQVGIEEILLPIYSGKYKIKNINFQ